MFHPLYNIINVQQYKKTRNKSKINSATMKIFKLDDLYSETITCPPQINTYNAVVGKETGHRGGQRYCSTVMHALGWTSGDKVTSSSEEISLHC